MLQYSVASEMSKSDCYSRRIKKSKSIQSQSLANKQKRKKQFCYPPTHKHRRVGAVLLAALARTSPQLTVSQSSTFLKCQLAYSIDGVYPANMCTHTCENTLQDPRDGRRTCVWLTVEEIARLFPHLRQLCIRCSSAKWRSNGILTVDALRKTNNSSATTCHNVAKSKEILNVCLKLQMSLAHLCIKTKNKNEYKLCTICFCFCFDL